MDGDGGPRARDVERRPRARHTLAGYGSVSVRLAVLRGYQRDASQSARVHGLHNGELEAHLRTRRWLLHHAPLAAVQPHDTGCLRVRRSFLAVAGENERGRPATARWPGCSDYRSVRSPYRHVYWGESHRPWTPVASRVAHTIARPDHYRLDDVGCPQLRRGALEEVRDRAQRCQGPATCARDPPDDGRRAAFRGESREVVPQLRRRTNDQLRP